MDSVCRGLLLLACQNTFSVSRGKVRKVVEVEVTQEAVKSACHGSIKGPRGNNANMGEQSGERKTESNG